MLARWEGEGWNIETVDEEGPFLFYVSLVLDSQDRPCIAYFKWYTASDLKYAHWTGTEWIIETVDAGDAGPFCSLALDSSDRPHIAYLDWGANELKYAHWDGDEWQYEYVETGGDTCYYISLALDSNDHPHISYQKQDDEDDLKYAHWDGSVWQIETVDTEEEVGEFSSIAVDSNDLPHIAYLYYIQAPETAHLRYAYLDGDVWRIETVDSDGLAGGYTSIALDSADRPHISYYEYSYETTRYARWDGERWLIYDLDPHACGDHTSMEVDSFDQPHISYTGFGTDSSRVFYGLKYAWYEVFFHLLSPGKGDTIYEFPFTFDWEDQQIPNLESYTLWWSTDPDFNTYNEIKDLHESEYTISGGIEDGARVYWRVKSLDDGGGEYWAEELDWYFDVDLGGGVDVVDFAAGATDEGFLVNWRLSGEEPAGVRVLRGADGPEMISGNLPGGSSRYLDRDVEPGGSYAYWLEVIDAEGVVSRFGPSEAVTLPVETFELVLYAAYPSPSRDTVNFTYSLSADGRVVLSVYDLSGRRIATLIDSELTAGRHDISCDASALPPGVYLARLATDSGSLTRRVVIAR